MGDVRVRCTVPHCTVLLHMVWYDLVRYHMYGGGWYVPVTTCTCGYFTYGDLCVYGRMSASYFEVESNIRSIVAIHIK